MQLSLTDRITRDMMKKTQERRRAGRMGRDERQLRRMRGEALSRLLQGLTYGGCLVIFYALMAIPNLICLLLLSKEIATDMQEFQKVLAEEKAAKKRA